MVVVVVLEVNIVLNTLKNVLGRRSTVLGYRPISQSQGQGPFILIDFSSEMTFRASACLEIANGVIAVFLCF